MASAVELLQEERRRLADELKRIDQAIALLTKGKASTNGRRKGPTNGRRKKRGTMSAEGRQRIAEAQRKRWAARRAQADAAHIEQEVNPKRGRKKK